METTHLRRTHLQVASMNFRGRSLVLFYVLLTMVESQIWQITLRVQVPNT